MMFYKITEWPYVAVVDPRTGECLATWHKLDAVTFCDLITEFLTTHTNFEENTGDGALSPKKKSRLVCFFLILRYISYLWLVCTVF